MEANTLFYDNFALGFGQGTGGEDASHSGAWNVQQQSGTQDADSISCRPYSQAMLASYPNSLQRHELEEGIKNFVGQEMHLATTELGPLLVSTLGPRVPFIVNTETQLLNVMDSVPGGAPLYVTDWMYRCRQINQGAKKATRINPEAALSTTNHSVSFSQKLNVLSFWGDPVAVTFVARAQNAGQNTGIDLLRTMSDAELVAIRKAVNDDCWNGIIQPNFNPPNVTELGGLISRIKTNTVDNGYLEPNAVDIEEALNDISTQIGDDQCVMMTPREFVGSVRTLEVNRFGGNNPQAFKDYNTELAGTFAAYKVKADRIYDPDLGGYALPVIHDRDLPTGVSVIMSIKPEYCPRFAYFTIDGQIGPWSWVRPTYDANQTVFIMHGGTLDDTGEETRVSMINS